MEKMVLLYWAICLFGSYAVHLLANDPSLSKVRLYPEVHFLPAPFPTRATVNLKKVSTDPIHLNIPVFIFQVKNTSKMFFSPGLEPIALGIRRGRRCWYRSAAYSTAVPTTIVRLAVGEPYTKTALHTNSGSRNISFSPGFEPRASGG